MRNRKGFTLIEVLVVISVIAILVTIVVAVGTAVKSSSQRNTTTATLKILSGMLDQYRQETNKMDFAAPGPSYTTLDGPHAMTTFLIYAAAYPQMNKQLIALGSNYSPTANTVIDGYGNPIQCIVYTSGVSPPATYTLLPRAPYFVSTGPDGQIGTPDDVYSYDP